MFRRKKQERKPDGWYIHEEHNGLTRERRWRLSYSRDLSHWPMSIMPPPLPPTQYFDDYESAVAAYRNKVGWQRGEGFQP